MFLTQEDRDAIKSSWRLVIPIKETAAELFYRRLFETNPEYQSLFKSDMRAQKLKLVAMLNFIVKTLDWPDTMWQQEVDEQNDLFLVVLAMGRRHNELYGIPPESYEAVRDALMFALDYGLGEAFTSDTRKAWVRLYNLVSMTMQMANTSAGMGQPMDPSAAEEMV